MIFLFRPSSFFSDHSSLIIRHSSLVLCLLLFVICCVFPAYAQEEEGVITCTGDRIEFLTEEKMVIGRGSVVVLYEDIKMTCDKAVINLDKKEGHLEGNVVLYQEGAIFRADKIDYDFEDKKGVFIDGRIEFEPWYGRGEEILKVGDTEYLIKNGYMSTCNFDPPHYRIQAKEVKIFLDDKVVARNIKLYIDNYPVFYLPIYVHSLKDKRQKISITPGKQKDWGGYLLGQYRYWINSNSNGYIHVDWRELRGWAGGVDYDYNSSRFGEGSVNTYYLEDLNKQFELVEQQVREDRYRAEWRHRWQINEETLVQSEFHKFSDINIMKEFFEEEYELEQQPRSFLAVTTTKPDYVLNLTAQARANKFFSVVERLPELSLNVPGLQLGETRFYYQTQTSASNLYKWTAGVTDSDSTIRFDSYNQISYANKLFNWLSVNPYIGGRETWYDKDTAGDYLNRGIFYAGTSLSTTFHRIFDLQTDFLGLDINGLRHLFEPGINYGYRYQPVGVERNKILQFDGIDGISNANYFTYTLGNKLQTKREIEREMQNTNLAELDFSISYYPGRETRRFSSLYSYFKLMPYNWLSCEIKAYYDTYEKYMDNVTFDLIASKDNWRFGIGNAYTKGSRENQLTAELAYKFNEKWSAQVYQRWNYLGDRFGNARVVEQEYTIRRDLHCWIGEFIWNRKDYDTFWFALKLKAFPQMEFRGRASYNPPRDLP